MGILASQKKTKNDDARSHSKELEGKGGGSNNQGRQRRGSRRYREIHGLLEKKEKPAISKKRLRKAARDSKKRNIDVS